MHKIGMIVNLLEIEDLLDVCEACMMGKQHLHPFPKDASMVETPLELFLEDLYVKMEMEALDGSYYYMTLIDGFSRRIWMYFLKTKDQALGKFIELHVMVEKASRKKVKILSSDRVVSSNQVNSKVTKKSHNQEAKTPYKYTSRME